MLYRLDVADYQLGFDSALTSDNLVLVICKQL